MENQPRNVQVKFWVTPEERSLIDQKMRQFGTQNMGAYLRKMAMDGYVVKLDLPELGAMISLLRRTSNNINQMARRMNASGRAYDTDMEDILRNQELIWRAANAILTRLANIR
jgi:hypothetical protein